MRFELLCEAIGAKRREAMIQTVKEYHHSINITSEFMHEKSVDASIQADPTNGIKPGVAEWILMHARPWYSEERSPEKVKSILILYEKVKKTKAWKKLKAETETSKLYGREWPKPHDPVLDQLHLWPSHAVFHDDLLQYNTTTKSHWDYGTLVAAVYCTIYEEQWVKQKQQKSQAIAEKGTKTIYNDGAYKIIRMTTPEAVQHWTADGGWCVKKEHYAKSYLEDGDLYLVYQNDTRWVLVNFSEKLPDDTMLELRNTSNKFPSSKEAYLLGSLFRKAGLLITRYFKTETKSKAETAKTLKNRRAIYQRCLKWASWDAVVKDSTEATMQANPKAQPDDIEDGLDTAANTIIDATFLAGNMGWPEPQQDIRPALAAAPIE